MITEFPPSLEESIQLVKAVDEGGTLPTAWYTDPDVFAQEKRLIFNRSWHFVGHTDQVAETGDFFTARAGDVPILVVRDHSGILRGYVNVCRHRACEVVADESGRRRSFQCPYHAWTYGLDGALKAAPKGKRQAGFDATQHSLLPARVATWGPFVFVNPDTDVEGGESFARHLGKLPGIIADTGVDLDVLRWRRRLTYDVAANWKVMVENFVECYHCALVHPAFAKTVELDQFRIVTDENAIIEVLPTRHAQRHPADNGGTVADGSYNYLWPLFILNVFPGSGGSAFGRRLVPVDVDRTVVTYDLFYAPEVTPEEEEENCRVADQILSEDIPLVESVQRGLASGRFESGLLFLPEEDGPQHFARLVLNALRRS